MSSCDSWFLLSARHNSMLFMWFLSNCTKSPARISLQLSFCPQEAEVLGYKRSALAYCFLDSGHLCNAALCPYPLLSARSFDFCLEIFCFLLKLLLLFVELNPLLVCVFSGPQENVSHGGHTNRFRNRYVSQEKIPRRRAWQPTPVFLPGESRGQRSPMQYSPWGHKESDTTEVTACTCEPIEAKQMHWNVTGILEEDVDAFGHLITGKGEPADKGPGSSYKKEIITCCCSVI